MEDLDFRKQQPKTISSSTSSALNEEYNKVDIEKLRTEIPCVLGLRVSAFRLQGFAKMDVLSRRIMKASEPVSRQAACLHLSHIRFALLPFALQETERLEKDPGQLIAL